MLELNPRSAKALYQLADLSMRRREFARAADTLEKGLTLAGDRAAFLVKLGEARIELKQFDAAADAHARSDQDQERSVDGPLQPRLVL